MDLSNLSQEDIDSIKNQLSQIEPGTEGTVRVGYGDSEFRVYMPEEINYDTGIQIAGRGGGGTIGFRVKNTTASTVEEWINYLNTNEINIISTTNNIIIIKTTNTIVLLLAFIY